VEYLHALGMPKARCTARAIWSALLEGIANGAWWRASIDLMLREGPLARRILRALDGSIDRGRLHAVYSALCQCLEDGRMFR
ncbi:MAG TPA: glutamate--cysteine ligase, partial [Casimicrobiaceae bacterium]|nr:glutamate--cysteine ligase [Casimicrobiaceae bacterium]